MTYRLFQEEKSQGFNETPDHLFYKMQCKVSLLNYFFNARICLKLYNHVFQIFEFRMSSADFLKILSHMKCA